MITWAALFLAFALVAAQLGFLGVAGTVASIAWLLFVVGLILAIVFAVSTRRPTG